MPATEKKTSKSSLRTVSPPASAKRRNGAVTNGVIHAETERKPRPKWPSSHSKSRQQATLQSALEAGSDRLEVAYHSQQVKLSLFVEGQELLHGTWGATIKSGEHNWPVAGPWELNLWYADADCDFLEVTCLVAEGLRVDRQILLSRTERFAMLADAVGHVPGDQIEYSARWSVVPRLSTEQPTRTPEVSLRQGRRTVARLFPVGVPQEKNDGTGRAGSFGPPKVLNGSGPAVELRQSATGTALFAPVIIDWHPDRRNAPADWRALTVTEEEVIIRPDQASGYRIRIGDYQLLLFRSLQATQDSRCLLGYHTRFETAIGQFLASGNFRQIIATIPDPG